LEFFFCQSKQVYIFDPLSLRPQHACLYVRSCLLTFLHETLDLYCIMQACLHVFCQ
jgi:hypothetical protein